MLAIYHKDLSRQISGSLVANKTSELYSQSPPASHPPVSNIYRKACTHGSCTYCGNQIARRCHKPTKLRVSLVLSHLLVHSSFCIDQSVLPSNPYIKGNNGIFICTISRQVLRLEANVPFSRVPGAGALLAASLRAAVKAGGCRHLWSMSVTLNDFDGSFFMNAPRKTKQTAGSATTGPVRSSSGKAAAPSALSRQAPNHPMNALALSRAFHPRAPGGGAGALLNEHDESGSAKTRGGVREKQSKASAGSSRGSITSLGLPYARLHHRTVEELATHAVSSLTHLDLSHCHVGAAGAASLARALDGYGGSTADDVENGVANNKGVGNSKVSGNRGRGSRSLRSLNLQHNFVGDSGARALGRALVNNRCLTFLSLASNGIGSAGGRALAATLDARGGGDGTLARLDVGDNPLGENATKLLVSASTAPSGIERGDGRVCGAAAVQILGLDRVAGAAVATREAARRAVAPAAAAAAEVGLGKDGVVMAGAPTLVTVEENIRVQSEDATGDDGLVQVMLFTWGGAEMVGT